MLKQGDSVAARRGDDWCAGTVTRSLFRGIEVDVRLDDGTILRGLTSKDVKIRDEE